MKKLIFITLILILERILPKLGVVSNCAGTVTSLERSDILAPKSGKPRFLAKSKGHLWASFGKLVFPKLGQVSNCAGTVSVFELSDLFGQIRGVPKFLTKRNGLLRASFSEFMNQMIPKRMFVLLIHKPWGTYTY